MSTDVQAVLCAADRKQLVSQNEHRHRAARAQGPHCPGVLAW